MLQATTMASPTTAARAKEEAAKARVAFLTAGPLEASEVQAQTFQCIRVVLHLPSVCLPQPCRSFSISTAECVTSPP